MASGRKKGYKHSSETIEKLRKAKLGRKRKPFTDETKKKMSLGRKGKPSSMGMLGKKRPKEFIEMMRKLHTGRKCSLKTRLKMSNSHKVKKSHFWKGGLTKINAKIRNSIEYRLWKEAVFKRDDYKCVWCGSEEKIEADHIKTFALYPELRFAIDNGRTLCNECHKTTDSYLNKHFK